MEKAFVFATAIQINQTVTAVLWNTCSLWEQFLSFDTQIDCKFNHTGFNWS